MVKRSTWILLGVLTLTIGAYFYFKSRPLTSTESTPTAPSAAYLINETENLMSISVSDSVSNAIMIERETNGSWAISQPTAGPADQSLVTAAETQVSSLRIITKMEIPPELSVIGLNKPSYTIKLMYINGTEHTIEIGSRTSTGSGYYVRLDGGDIYIVSTSIDTLTQLLSNPPYAATNTPEPQSTGTITPSP